jgi:hypothetical protein
MTQHGPDRVSERVGGQIGRAVNFQMTGEDEPDDLRAFLLVLRRALLMVVSYIDQRYRS